MIPTLDIVSLILACLLGMAVGGNNLSACCGPLIGSGMVNRRTGILLAITGYLLGLALEGPKLFRVREIFLPIDTATGTFSILLASLIVFLGGELSQIPLSLSKALTGAILGVSIALGTFNSSGYLSLILAFWFLVPLIATALGILLVGLDDRLSPRSLWLKLSLLKTGLLVVSFLSAYVLGSNTLGLIAGVVYNQTLGVPLSITETVSSGIIGSGLARRMRMMNARNVFLIVSSWIISPLTGFALAFVLTKIL